MSKLKRFWNFIWTSAICSVAITLVLLVIGLLLAERIVHFLIASTPSTSAWVTVINYADFLGIWFVFVLVMIISSRSRPFLKKLGPNSGNSWKYTAMGALIGFGTNTICIVSAIVGKQIFLSPTNETTVLELILIFFSVLIQSGAEELVCRLYLYQRIKQRYPSEIPSAIITGVFFGLLHMYNNGVTPLAILSIIVIGIQYSAIIYFFDAFWACAFAHTLWNFTQNIIFGLPNSGMVSQYSILRLDAAADVNSFVYHNEFGVESTWMAVIVNAVVTAVIIYFGIKKKQSSISKSDANVEEICSEKDM